MGYRVHQWSASDTGVRGRSSGIGRRKPEDEAAGKVWAAHAAEEIANWEVFLPTSTSSGGSSTTRARTPSRTCPSTAAVEQATYRSIVRA